VLVLMSQLARLPPCAFSCEHPCPATQINTQL
jgi:hypothetical protein